MSKEQIINCAFCKGSGSHPHYSTGNCPVCKGRGKNQITGKYMTCGSCRGSGGKGGTTLTCYDCGGLGVIPDTRETFRQAQEEIKAAREEITREVEGLTEKPVMKVTELLKLLERKDEEDDWGEQKAAEESSEKTHFCQCCGDKVNKSVKIKICLDCLSKVKELRKEA